MEEWNDGMMEEWKNGRMVEEFDNLAIRQFDNSTPIIPIAIGIGATMEEGKNGRMWRWNPDSYRKKMKDCKWPLLTANWRLPTADC